MRIRNTVAHYADNIKYDTAYQFGVFNGDSLFDIANLFKRKNKPLNHLFGFDSFIGFPENDGRQSDWSTGSLNTCEHLGVNTIEECVDVIYKKVTPGLQPETKLELIPGFFSDVLTKENVQKYNMGPAAYIDIDCDLYESAIECLEFVVQNGILQPGTLIWYDDWGGTEGWDEYRDGEPRAHKEISDKYNIESTLLLQIGDSSPHIQRLYIVKKY